MNITLVVVHSTPHRHVESIDQPEISPSEVAILQCMMTGGRRLDLKAHFISQLPDLSPLTGTLTYLNLSFNCINVSSLSLQE